MSKNSLGLDLCAMSNVVLRVGQSLETGFEQRRRRDEEKAAGFIVLLIRHPHIKTSSKSPAGGLLSHIRILNLDTKTPTRVNAFQEGFAFRRIFLLSSCQCLTH